MGVARRARTKVLRAKVLGLKLDDTVGCVGGNGHLGVVRSLVHLLNGLRNDADACNQL